MVAWRLRLEVAGENPSPLERLLAETVVATWLQVQLFDALYGFGMKNKIISQGDYRQKRLDRAPSAPVRRSYAGSDSQDGIGGANQHSGEADQNYELALIASLSFELCRTTENAAFTRRPIDSKYI